MNLKIGIVIELAAIVSLLHFTKNIRNILFRTFGVALFAYVIANAIYWFLVWVGITDGKQVLSDPNFFIFLLTAFGIAIGGLVFWIVESMKNNFS